MKVNEIILQEGALDYIKSKFRSMMASANAPKGFRPFPGDALEAYNAFWDTDRIPQDVSTNDYHRSVGTRYEREGDLTIKYEHGRPTMAATFDDDYDDYTRSSMVSTQGSADRMRVYVTA